MYRKIGRLRFMKNRRLLVFLISCLCLHEIFKSKNDYSEFRFQVATTSDFYLQSVGRKILGNPGSFPPLCTSKCGSCTPCEPVHVPVPPGAPVMAEYYPEAWRCKCDNRLYMP